MTSFDDQATWFVVVPLWTVTLWRMPSALRRPASRTLWYVFLSLAVTMTTRLSGVEHFLYDVTGLRNSATLVKHLIGVLAITLMLRWVLTVSAPELGHPDCSYRQVVGGRTAKMLTWGMVAFITVVFPLANGGNSSHVLEDSDFLFLQAGHLWGTLHLLPFYLYLVYGLSCSALLCADAGRRDRTTVFGGGLRMMAIGFVCGSMYGVIRSGYLICRLAHRRFFGGEPLVIFASNVALILCVVLIIIGSSAQIVERANRCMRAYDDIQDLRPMWRQITPAVPEVVLCARRRPMAVRFADEHPTANRRLTYVATEIRDWIGWRKLHYKLHRQVTEILDAARTLQGYVPDGLPAQVEQAVRDLGLPDPAVQAYLLRTAIQRKENGGAPSDGQSLRCILQTHGDVYQAVQMLLPVGRMMRSGPAMKLIDRHVAATPTPA